MRIDCTRTPQEDGKAVPADIDRLTAAITTALRVREVYLFGSGATGRLTASSDLDLAIAVEPPPREPKRSTDTSGGMEWIKRVDAARRRQEATVERAVRKGVGWRRALDIVHLRPGEISREAYRETVTHGIRTTGIRLNDENGWPIPWRQALKKRPVAPDAQGKTIETGDLLEEMRGWSFNAMDRALLLAGRKNAGPTRLHKVSHLAARAVRDGLRHRILTAGVQPPLHGELQKLEALRLERSPRSTRIPVHRLALLATSQRRWRFVGEHVPTMTDALQALWDAKTALDTLRGDDETVYYPATGFDRLMERLATLAGLYRDPIADFESARLAHWPDLDIS